MTRPILALLVALLLPLSGCAPLTNYAAGLWQSIAHPAPAPEPPAPPSVDAIPVGEIVWHHASPAAFPVTAALADVRVALSATGAGPLLSWHWMAPADWPADGNGVVGNLWIIARIDGKYHAATWEWLRRTTQAKATEAKVGEPPFIQAEAAPINAWRPASGETVWHMASSPCRAGCTGVRGRSPIVATVWP